MRSIVESGGGLLYSYVDPHVTNCCAAWFCPAGTGSGYPKYAHLPAPEIGYANLAVFLYGCNFNCLFCQNSNHKLLLEGLHVGQNYISEQIAKNKRVSCVCYFGGSPEPQLPFVIASSKIALEDNPARIIRICFEWNGCGNPELVRRAAELALTSGGNIKFDLKCFSPTLSLALSGVANTQAYQNFRMVAKDFWSRRRELPVITATTPLITGYVDAYEVESIARFIAEVNEEVPYSLLVFYPRFFMSDLPPTPEEQVVECYRAAKKHLHHVHVGNLSPAKARLLLT
jgi:pyruvate formate lyase activating enzyme